MQAIGTHRVEIAFPNARGGCFTVFHRVDFHYNRPDPGDIAKDRQCRKFRAPLPGRTDG